MCACACACACECVCVCVCVYIRSCAYMRIRMWCMHEYIVLLPYDTVFLSNKLSWICNGFSFEWLLINSLDFRFTVDKCEGCSANAHCKQGHCVCKPGFIGNGYKCKCKYISFYSTNFKIYIKHLTLNVAR